MKAGYSVQTIRELEEIFHSQKIVRPLRIQRYEPGTELVYNIQGVIPPRPGRIKLEVQKFVGGGYAGQVYRVKALELETPDGPIEGIYPGKEYALKILIPPKGFSVLFRNLIYGLGFQGPFSPQSNPQACRAGALWQKFIRRGAEIRLGSEKAVVDIYATFIDHNLGSCGEVSEWVEGRMWRFEVDDNLEARLKWKTGEPSEGLGSPEYRAKKAFMFRLVKLMHEMGARELARQYEWWTLKSQPNALKRIQNGPNPEEGLVAVDFKAGLALLPFLPQCPADFKLIIQGLARGSLVQFDRGSLEKLESFVNRHQESFAGMKEALEELKKAEKAYRSSLPDITHHHLRLATSRSLRSSIRKGQVTSWAIRNLSDEKTSARLRQNSLLCFLFWLLGLVPWLGKFLRRLWGQAEFRRHYWLLFSSPGYFRRASRARIAEALIRWHRAGRASERRAQTLCEHPFRFLANLPLSLLPPGLHRFLTDWGYTRQVFDNIFIRPARLYFKAEAREQWLQDIVSQGKKRGTLTQEEAGQIQSQIKEPFIQKYLKSLAVHVCTLPVTQIVSVTIAIIYIKLHPELTWQEASVHAGLILGLFQVTPISPGSLVRGLYVTYLVLREKNFKDYSVAFFLSFFKYIGYLAFPIQMAYRYPNLARFMAAHWATSAVRILPVFGEHGALLEHAAFDAFFNYPLTLRRRISQRKRARAALKPRYWPALLGILAGVLILTLADLVYFKLAGNIPQFRDLWCLSIWVPALAAGASTAWAGGAALSRRFLLGLLCGAALGLLSALANTALAEFLFPAETQTMTALQLLGRLTTSGLWRAFLFSLMSLVAVFLVETRPLKQSALAARKKIPMV